MLYLYGHSNPKSDKITLQLFSHLQCLVWNPKACSTSFVLQSYIERVIWSLPNHVCCFGMGPPKPPAYFATTSAHLEPIAKLTKPTASLQIVGKSCNIRGSPSKVLKGTIFLHLFLAGWSWCFCIENVFLNVLRVFLSFTLTLHSAFFSRRRPFAAKRRKGRPVEAIGPENVLENTGYGLLGNSQKSSNGMTSQKCQGLSHPFLQRGIPAQVFEASILLVITTKSWGYSYIFWSDFITIMTGKSAQSTQYFGLSSCILSELFRASDKVWSITPRLTLLTFRPLPSSYDQFWSSRVRL